MSLYAIPFKKGVAMQVKIDDDNFLFNAVPLKPDQIPEEERLIKEALETPIGTAKLEELIRPKNRVVVLIDDITRPTPSARILPQILSRIKKAGVPRSRVQIIMALGTHRPMTEEELEIKLGCRVMDDYEVINRDYRDTSNFVSLGKTESATPIELYREVIEADLIIAIGNIVPHISSGWGGGSKIILPGVCSQKTTDMMHLMACIVQPVLEVIGTRDNKPRAEMDTIAEKVGLNFIVNTVLDEDNNILAVFAGHFIQAHKKGVEAAEKLMVVPIPGQADILIVSANPCHFDYWQGVKPYVYSHRAVRKGGVIIFLLDGGEGLCGDAPSHEKTMRKYLLHSFKDLEAAVDRGEVDDIVGLNVPMYHSTLRHRVTTFCVTNHLRQEDIKALGFISAPNVQTALKRAFEIVGQDGKVGIIPYGGETLTRLEDNSKPWREESS